MELRHSFNGTTIIESIHIGISSNLLHVRFFLFCSFIHQIYNMKQAHQRIKSSMFISF